MGHKLRHFHQSSEAKKKNKIVPDYQIAGKHVVESQSAQAVEHVN